MQGGVSARESSLSMHVKKTKSTLVQALLCRLCCGARHGIDGKMHKSGQHCMRNKLSPHSRAAMHGACATGGKQASRRGERGSFEGRQQQQARKMHKSVNAREINKVHGTRAGLCFPREEEEGAERAWQREHGKESMAN